MICRDCLIQFQFQYGTIKTILMSVDNTYLKIFQFQYGTIKTYKGHTSRQLDFDFNSIMVQLKQAFSNILQSSQLISIP